MLITQDGGQKLDLIKTNSSSDAPSDDWGKGFGAKATVSQRGSPNVGNRPSVKGGSR